MPSSCSEVVRKQSSTAAAKLKKPQRRAPRAQPKPSPLISDGATTEADLCTWTNSFARFHTDPTELYVPLALRTVDCIVTLRQQTPAEPLAPRLMRCVREVAKFNGAQGVEWKLITWIPGLPGAQFQGCASHDDAMNLLDAPPAPVTF